jgi:hypothetical protein
MGLQLCAKCQECCRQDSSALGISLWFDASLAARPMSPGRSHDKCSMQYRSAFSNHPVLKGVPSSSCGEDEASQVKGIIQPMYSSPPRHGAAIAGVILGDPAPATRVPC